jgi:hypothetical protein
LLGVGAAAHGGLTIPPARNNYGNSDPMNRSSGTYQKGGPCAGDECLWFSEGCWIGCPSCSSFLPAEGNYFGAPNCTGGHVIEPTLPESFRTWNIGNVSSHGDWTKYHPWRSPGRAPVSDPCGSAGGYLQSQGGGGQTPIGAKQMDKGSRLPKHPNVTTEWLAGGLAEVGWMVGANHGGGYQYSVCPAGESITEACFNAHVLPYVGGNTTIRYLDGRGEIIIPAVDVAEGTFPEGSAWRRNPIPACNCDGGDGCQGVNASNAGGRQSYAADAPPSPFGFPCAHGTMFPVPFEYGYGQHVWNNPPGSPQALTWVMVDSVQVPAARGEYVLRWRWDAEQNPQVRVVLVVVVVVQLWWGIVCWK